MSFDFSNVPDELSPYLVMNDLNGPIVVSNRPLQLKCATTSTNLDGDLVFRWNPTTALEFRGAALISPNAFAENDWHLAGTTPAPFEVAALLTNVQPRQVASAVSGIAVSGFQIGGGPFERLRFCLVGLPDYLGAGVKYAVEGGRQGLASGRLEFSSNTGTCVVDKIRQVEHLVKQSRRDGGFVITHVGQWTPAAGSMSPQEAESLLTMLHFWFGLIRGAWAGPMFGQGLAGDNVVWQEFAPWKIDESREVPTWIPEHSPLEISALFQGFVNRWSDQSWYEPLRTAIAWLVEANSSWISHESRIVLAQVALETLSWVHLVETRAICKRGDFKRLPAADRLRRLLHDVGVQLAIPSFMIDLAHLCDNDAPDGPGVISKIRNALVHSTAPKRKSIAQVDGTQLWECAQLALGYVELTLLAVCGYRGVHSRRGFRRGWKGQDEAPVPWA